MKAIHPTHSYTSNTQLYIQHTAIKPHTLGKPSQQYPVFQVPLQLAVSTSQSRQNSRTTTSQTDLSHLKQKTCCPRQRGCHPISMPPFTLHYLPHSNKNHRYQNLGAVIKFHDLQSLGLLRLSGNYCGGNSLKIAAASGHEAQALAGTHCTPHSTASVGGSTASIDGEIESQ